MHELLFDIEYLTGATSAEILEGMDEDMTTLEVTYTLDELKGLILGRLMQEEDKS